MADKIQIRRDTAANWTSANPVLAQGELALETDTKKIKAGNGTAAWSALAYYAIEANSDGSITTPKLANEAVTEAKINISNAPVNGYMLTAQSAAAGGMTWAAVAASAPVELLSTTTISANVSNVAFTLPTGYIAYELFLSDIGSTTLYPFLQAHYSKDNGSTYDLGNSYRTMATGNGATNALRMHTGEMRGASSFRLLIQGAKLNGRTVMTGSSALSGDTGDTIQNYVYYLTGGLYVDNGVVTNVRFKFNDNSSFDHGTFSLYGRK